jgi:hypothetical protein
MTSARIETRKERSARLFKNLVWPRLAPLVGGTKLVSAEDDPGEFATLMDYNGVDAVAIMHGGMRFLSVRISTPWDPPTWTLRRAEQERLRKRHPGDHAPDYFVQAYVTREEELVCVASVPWLLLRQLMLGGKGEERINREDGKPFLYFDWDLLPPDTWDVARWPGLVPAVSVTGTMFDTEPWLERDRLHDYTGDRGLGPDNLRVRPGNDRYLVLKAHGVVQGVPLVNDEVMSIVQHRPVQVHPRINELLIRGDLEEVGKRLKGTRMARECRITEQGIQTLQIKEGDA